MSVTRMTAGVFSLVLTASLVAPAQAGPDRATPVVAEAATTAAERAAVAAYWTADRLASAQPRNLQGEPMEATAPAGTPRHVPAAKPDNPGGGKPGGGGGGGGGDGGDGGDGGGGTGEVEVKGTAWTTDLPGVGDVVDTTGKLFFSIGTSNYQCSASVVSSTAGNVALTAGHCVHDGAGGAFATNVQFIPAFDDGARPHGTWIAKALVTTTGWAQGVGGGYDFNNDVGFAVLASGGAGAPTSVESAVGAQGIAFSQTRGLQMWSFGYPAEKKYDGGDLIHCADVVVDDPYGSNDQGMVCNMNGGSSGGPWYLGFDVETATGTANSVNSFTYRGISNVMWGPYFGNAAEAAYDAANANPGSNGTA